METGTKVTLNINSSIGDLIFKEDPNDKYNPHNLEGEIIQIGNDKIRSNPVIVQWSNGYRNSYEYRNLLEV